jgi:Acyl CoA:acetate/3-ketoacid CoA transferase
MSTRGAILGPLDQALSVRNNGGLVIAQVKRLAAAGPCGRMTSLSRESSSM